MAGLVRGVGAQEGLGGGAGGGNLGGCTGGEDGGREVLSFGMGIDGVGVREHGKDGRVQSSERQRD